MRLSVISPSYNQAQFLPDNLATVAAQTYADVEHIIVDPGSTDGSRELAAKSDGIVLIAEPDNGQSDGISKGFARSTGDILTWLNSDDFYPTDDIAAAVVEAFKENPDTDVIYGDVNFVGEEKEFLRKGFINPLPEKLLKSFEYQVGIVQPGVFMRREVFDKIGGPSQSFEYCMDYEYWVRIASSGFKWKKLDKVLAHHRWWGGMKTSRGRGDSLIEHFRVCNQYFGYIHWKWLDRYAEYCLTSADGVVNHATTVDKEAKGLIARGVIERYVTQDMLRKLRLSDDKEHVDTLNYIETWAADSARQTYFEAGDIEIASEVSDDPHAAQRPAWNIFDATSASSQALKAYHVPANFDRYFDADWYREHVETAGAEMRALQRRNDICVVIGNGPSLNKSNLQLLAHADVIISNFAITSERVAKYATYVTVVNDLVAKQGSVEFNRCETTKIVPFWLANSINPTSETIFVPATVIPTFNGDADSVFSWRSTVSFFNMQVAFALGYEKVILIGFDHSYVQPEGVKEGDAIVQKADDDNHFDPSYFRDRTWQAADTGNMEKMYVLVREAYEKAGRDIVNCTVGGKLEVFRRGSLEIEIFDTPSSAPKSRQEDFTDTQNGGLSRILSWFGISRS